jgi:hypothetical protein
MAITLSKRGRVAIKQQSAWGTPETSFAATDYLEVEAPFVPPLARESLRPDTYREGYTEPPIEPGSKSPTELTFRFPLHGWSATTPAADPTVFPDALLFLCALGSGKGDGYSTANLGGGSPADEGTTYTDVTADALWIGHAISYPTAATRTIAWLDDVATGVSPDTASFIVATPRDVLTGTAFGSYVAYQSLSEQLPLTFDWFGSDANAHIRYSDGLPTSVRLVLAAKQLPMVEVSMRFLTWSNLGTGGAPTPTAYGYPLIPATLGVNGSYSSINGTEFCYATCTIELTQELSENECSGSTEGASSMSVSGEGRRATVEIIFLDSDLATIGIGSGSAPGDALGGPMQIDLATATGGRSASILIPTPVLIEQPTVQDLGGKLATRVLIGARIYTGDTGSTAPADTPVRIAWL